VGVALVEGGGRRLSFTASDRDHRSDIDWCEVDAFDDVPLNNTVRTGKVILGSLDELAARYTEFVDGQQSATRALASVPLVAAGRVLGGFVLFYSTRQSFDDRQQTELRRLGEELGADLSRIQRTRPLADPSGAESAVPTGARVSSQVIAPELDAVATARQFVRRTLSAWHIQGESLDVAVLCVSELVTNAIIHTVAGCEVRLQLHQGVLTLSVRDGGTETRGAHTLTEDPLAVHGRGLRLVDLISDRWGSQLDAEGMTVWCELDLT
jgi:anti-sigma regulatory factor (Ser/Thr protein kinase)